MGKDFVISKIIRPSWPKRASYLLRDGKADQDVKCSYLILLISQATKIITQHVFLNFLLSLTSGVNELKRKVKFENFTMNILSQRTFFIFVISVFSLSYQNFGEIW